MIQNLDSVGFVFTFSKKKTALKGAVGHQVPGVSQPGLLATVSGIGTSLFLGSHCQRLTLSDLCDAAAIPEAWLLRLVIR